MIRGRAYAVPLVSAMLLAGGAAIVASGEEQPPSRFAGTSAIAT